MSLEDGFDIRMRLRILPIRKSSGPRKASKALKADTRERQFTLTSLVDQATTNHNLSIVGYRCCKWFRTTKELSNGELLKKSLVGEVDIFVASRSAWLVRFNVNGEIEQVLMNAEQVAKAIHIAYHNGVDVTSKMSLVV
ncbi:hypothetical protein H310_12308 [Aphanomyces invadans]|uniref:Uncharacterized protein n=1 Tax=Aphanomyces invadans TaxID=157072 RepID=A0A024TK49_9STRA|nr:hypothetical protein H310_12308 [Aphanomyces invadans]ETV93732.1 hypothetical protein H310_12308 [Aphanomyces invadans]|eukprot:XP_008877541.1 hypothetical protein H310_12308 [Aphanomyces invadans]